ncbi:MAG: LysE family transporter [Rhodospirillales bacterium]|nr:LysE family transporter [Rhodospirillales bacterium]
MELDTWLTFLAIAIAGPIAPGPNAAFTVGVTTRFGTRSGLTTALGFGTATGIYVALVGLGLGTLLLASAAAFEVLRWIGVGYLVYLGIMFWKATPEADDKTDIPASASRLYFQAIMISLTNPKAALYFTLVLPPFLSADTPTGPQLFVLALTSVVVSFIVYGTYTLAADQLRRWTPTRSQAVARNRLLGSLFIGAGAALALIDRR